MVKDVATELARVLALRHVLVDAPCWVPVVGAAVRGAREGCEAEGDNRAEHRASRVVLLVRGGRWGRARVAQLSVLVPHVPLVPVPGSEAGSTTMQPTSARVPTTTVVPVL